MSADLIARLRRDAEAATPGPWYLRDELTDEEASQAGGSPADVLVATEENDDTVSLIHDLWGERNARHIANWSPDRALAALRVIETALALSARGTLAEHEDWVRQRDALSDWDRLGEPKP